MLTKLSDKEKVLLYMIQSHKPFHYSYDFIGDKGSVFLSHRGPARVSDLAREFPEMIFTDSGEKTYKYRFRFDNSHEFLKVLPLKMSLFVQNALKSAGIRYRKEVTEAVKSLDGNSVAMVKRVVEV